MSKSVVEKILEVIGAKDGDEINFVTPQFTRPESWPKPSEAPIGMKAFAALFSLPKQKLIELGLGNWNGKLMLFPKEWYNAIPKDFPIESINGEIEPFEPGVTDDDIRFGYLAYGISAFDGVEEDEHNQTY